MTLLNTTGQHLAHSLAHSRVQHQAADGGGQTVHVVGAGASLTAAYEQLRNAAEYAEEHVLLQRAIRRFYKRIFMLHDSRRIGSSGDELIIELTQAGYLQNDSVSENTAQKITAIAKGHYHAYESFQQRSDITREQSDRWTYEVLAVEIEQVLHNTGYLGAFVQFAFDHFSRSIDFQQVFNEVPQSAEISLYVAVQRALLKSDDATLRLSLLHRFQQTSDGSDQHIELNRRIDGLLSSPVTEKLFRIVDRRGAPLRVLRHMIDSNTDIDSLLQNKEQFLYAYESQVRSDYEAVNERINKGIIKSVIFLIITKFLIGIVIEIPYDYLVAGMILWLPLAINLLFPPIYMVLLRATMLLPGDANTKRLTEQIETMLYQTEQSKQLTRRANQEFGNSFNIAYAGLFIVVFGGVAFALWRFFEFDIVHLLIFFVFLSAASFLGFRLSRMIRELESIETYQNGVTLTRDFLYMPFVVVGRYLSDKYAKVNVVALALDMLIELPLKTVLRLIRQWAAFISAKKDQL